MIRITRNLETFLRQCGYREYKNVIIKSLCDPISIKFFLMQSNCVRVSHEHGSHRYMMHSTFLIGQDAINRMYCEVNKH